MNSSPKKNWHPVEHLVLRELQKLPQMVPKWSSEKEQNLGILALSGGVDSVVLGSVLHSLQSVLPFEWVVATVHHGFSQDEKLLGYRDQTAKFCEEWASQLGQPFYLLGGAQLQNGSELKSEESLRDWRYEQLEKLKKTLKEKNCYKNIFFILAQHQDDLLETRLLRLLRGTGLEGLSAMELWKAYKLRPLLGVNKKDILVYAHEKNLQWIEDPSNHSDDPLRNWLRNNWLPQLETKSEGSLRSFARSLELILEQSQENSQELEALESYNFSQGIELVDYLTWSEIKQRRVLALYMKFLGCQNFTQAHLREIQKQLDKIQVVHTFTVARLQWGINAKRIVAKPLVTHL